MKSRWLRPKTTFLPRLDNNIYSVLVKTYCDPQNCSVLQQIEVRCSAVVEGPAVWSCGPSDSAVLVLLRGRHNESSLCKKSLIQHSQTLMFWDCRSGQPFLFRFIIST